MIDKFWCVFYASQCTRKYTFVPIPTGQVCLCNETIGDVYRRAIPLVTCGLLSVLADFT